jgi:hypothetical protein
MHGLYQNPTEMEESRVVKGEMRSIVRIAIILIALLEDSITIARLSKGVMDANMGNGNTLDLI